jgi:hypothetical protein
MVPFALIFSSCEPDQEIVFIIETPVQGYYDRFIDEAAQRGLDVAYAASQVEARIGSIDEPNVIGTCSWTQSHQHSIVLEEEYWRTATDMQREFLVFHELGHCVLGRGHVDNADANGNCISVMSSGTGDCRVFYSQNNRRRLLDELFSEGI